MVKQTLEQFDFHNIEKLQKNFNLDRKLVLLLYMGIMYQTDFRCFSPKLFKERFEFGGVGFTQNDFKHLIPKLDNMGLIRKTDTDKENGSIVYFFHKELIDFISSGNEEYLEIFIEKKSLINKASRWFHHSYYERADNISGIIIDATNNIAYDPIMELIVEKHKSIHVRVAVIFLIGAFMEGIRSLAVNQLVSMSININSIKNKLILNWTNPESEIYGCGLLIPSSVVNDIVVSVALHSDFLNQTNLVKPVNQSNALSSKLFDLIKPEDIGFNKLIYPTDLQLRMDKYFKTISKDLFPTYLQNMKDQNLPENFSLMIYGESGVGKTSLVKQVAKKFNRPIFNVNLAELKTMWYGESERLIHQLFTDIRMATEELGIDPIVLFNEADGFFQNRTNFKHMNETNTNIITILLNELENFKGILIATSNYTDTIDKAFERRFVLKLHIPSPDRKAIKAIIKDKLNITNRAFIDKLLDKYQITPAEMDNVKQKSIILNIRPEHHNDIEELIKEEHAGWDMNKKRKHIGFN